MRNEHRHEFLFECKRPDGTKYEMKIPAKVRTPKKKVEFHITEEDVLRSMKLRGVGNSQTCTVACGLWRDSTAFSHPVVGPIEFFHSTCFVGSKNDKRGHVAECYRYKHNFAAIAKTNDKPGGQKALLEKIKRDGPITITLWPRKRRDRSKMGGTGHGSDGTRSTRLIGAKLRHANAMAGLSVAQPGV